MIDPRSCGGYYLGHPGALHRFDDAHEQLGLSWSEDARFQSAISGARRAYVTPRRGPRSWSVTIPHTASGDIAALHHLKVSARPPFTWVTPWSMVTNLLTPETSVLQLPGGHPTAGFTVLADGHSSPTVMAVSSTDTTTIGAAPVVRGRPVTGAVYADAGTVSMQWIDLAGAVLGTVSGSTQTSYLDLFAAYADPTVLHDATVAGPPLPAGVLARHWITGTPPAGASQVVLRCTGASKVARASVTWTDQPQPWHIGGGAPNVVLTEVRDNALHAVPNNPSLIRTGVGFTVEEVQS